MLLPWFAAAWLAGVGGASGLLFPTWQWLTLGVAALLAAYGVRRDRFSARLFLGLSLLFLGAMRAQIAEETRSTAKVTGHVGQSQVVDLGGVVSSRPETTGQGVRFDLRAQWIAHDGTPARQTVDGIVQVIAEPGISARPGESIVARGRLRPSMGRERIGHSGILEAESTLHLAPARASPMALLDITRERMVDRLEDVLPSAEASLIAGVLLGADERMPEEVRAAFRATGTAHILAVSGFNVTIVAAASLAAFATLLGARRAVLAAGATVLLYTLLAGAEPSVVRAAIMAGVVLLAARLGRQPQALASLAAAAILMTLWDPGCLWDVGFQLSFLATLGLVVAGRPAQEALRTWAEAAIRHETGRSAVILVGDLIVITAVAQAATLPLSAYIFRQVPITSLVANAFILPAQPPLMATGALAAFAALADVSLGRVVAWLAWPFAAYSIGAAQWFADLPGASLDLPAFGSGALVLVYAGLAGVVVVARTPRLRSMVRSGARLGGPLWLVTIAILATLAWRSALDRPDGRLHLTALPGGDVVVETPGGRFVALSRAAGQVGLARSLDRLLPVSHRRIDWLILAHPQASPREALETIGEFAPRGILLVGGAAAEEAQSEILPPGGEVTLEVSKGTALDLGGGARLEVRDPRSGRLTILISDGRATLALADYQDTSFLASLSRRVPAPQALVLLGEGRQVARALEAGWSGWEPEVVIACPSPGDPFPESLASLAGPTILATPHHGWVELVTDGEHLFVQAERDP